MKTRSYFSPTAFKKTELQIKFELLPIGWDPVWSSPCPAPWGPSPVPLFWVSPAALWTAQGFLLQCPCSGSSSARFHSPAPSGRPYLCTSQISAQSWLPQRKLLWAPFWDSSSSYLLSSTPIIYRYLKSSLCVLSYSLPTYHFAGPLLRGKTTFSLSCSILPAPGPCFGHQKFSTDICWMRIWTRVKNPNIKYPSRINNGEARSGKWVPRVEMYRRSHEDEGSSLCLLPSREHTAPPGK